MADLVLAGQAGVEHTSSVPEIETMDASSGEHLLPVDADHISGRPVVRRCCSWLGRSTVC